MYGVIDFAKLLVVRDDVLLLLSQVHGWMMLEPRPTFPTWATNLASLCDTPHRPRTLR